MSSRGVQWSDLPKELLLSIGERLDTRTDVLRFRAVSTSWRSSIPPFPANSPSFPIRFSHFVLIESTVYRLEPQQENSQSSISSQGWLVRVVESESGKVRLYNPLSIDEFMHLPWKFPKVLNLLDYRFFELSKAYTLRDISGNFPFNVSVNKAVFSSNFACTMDGCDSAVLMIHDRGKLALWKLGAEKWTAVSRQWLPYYTDILLYKGQFHAIDRCGEVVVIDSSLNLTKITSPIDDGAGSRKHLVESCGDLYVVDRYLDVDKRAWYWNENEEYYDYNDDGCHHITEDFKVYKLNYEGKHDWVEVKSLGNQVLFVGADCSFFVPAQDLTGYKGNCIYFTEDNFHYNSEDDFLNELLGPSSGVFNFEDRSIEKLGSFPGFSQIFWPPPTWLRQTSCPSGC